MCVIVLILSDHFLLILYKYYFHDSLCSKKKECVELLCMNLRYLFIVLEYICNSILCVFLAISRKEKKFVFFLKKFFFRGLFYDIGQRGDYWNEKKEKQIFRWYKKKNLFMSFLKVVYCDAKARLLERLDMSMFT